MIKPNFKFSRIRESINDKTEKMSVVIVTHNRSRIVEETLKSCIRQSEPPSEIIIVDDASTDDTVGVLKRFDFGPIPVKIIQNKKNFGGPAKPFNTGIACASGDIIALLEDDDIWHKDKMALSRKAFGVFPETGLVYADYQPFENEAPVLPDGLIDTGVRPRLVPHDEAVKTAMEKQFALSLSNMVFRKSCWKRAGGFPENFKICADYTFLARLLRAGCGVVHIPKTLIYYRVSQDSQYFGSNYIIRNFEKCWTLDFLFRTFPKSVDPHKKDELGAKIFDVADKSARTGKCFLAIYLYFWSLRHRVPPRRVFRAIGRVLIKLIFERDYK